MITPQSLQQPLVERIFGANWRTSLGGIGTTLGAIAAALAILPAETWKNPSVWVPAVVAAIAKTYKDCNTKDSKVSGTGSLDDPHTVNDGGASPRTILPSLVVALLLPALALSGCVTDQVTGKKRLATGSEIAAAVAKFQSNPDVQQAERAAGAAILSFIGSAAQNEVNGGHWDASFAIGAGMNSISAAVQNLPPSQAAKLIQNTAQNFAGGDVDTTNVGKKLALAYLKANPQTPAQQSATVVALGKGVVNSASTASQALP